MKWRREKYLSYEKKIVRKMQDTTEEPPSFASCVVHDQDGQTKGTEP